MNVNENWDPDKSYDFLIIGSGMGGSSIAHALSSLDASVLMIERGDFIKQEKENWSVPEIVLNKRYAADEVWLDKYNKEFQPRMYYNVGGNSKFFGGTAFRLRESDFNSNWPIKYKEMSPWYKKAEEILGVRGQSGDDPSEVSDQSYTLTPVKHEYTIEKLRAQLVKQGLHPFHLPVAIDSAAGGRCQKGSPCDGFPCMVRAKGDAENRFLRPLLLRSDSNLTLLTNAKVEKLVLDDQNDQIKSVEIYKDGVRTLQKAQTIILSAGAVNSAAVLLKSSTSSRPEGLSNSSGNVGRHYMAHRNSVLLALSPLKKNPTIFQKTLAVNDFYEQGWGNIQLRGKVKKEMLQRKNKVLFRLFPGFIAKRSIDLWLMSEDEADPANRVSIHNDRVKISLNERENKGHDSLIKSAKTMMKKAGYPICFIDRRGIEAVQHQCGTIRMGKTTENAVLDSWCRSFDHPNLFVVDASFFPGSAAVNPALTIAAMGLRVGDYLVKQYLKERSQLTDS